MKKTLLLLFSLTAFLLILTSCFLLPEGEHPCEHKWAEANCVAAKTCTECGETVGGIGDHVYSEATCTSPEICQGCGIWRGLAKGHDYAAATCQDPKTCKTCGHKNGDPAHDFVAATCTEAKFCDKCKITVGEPLGHKSVSSVIKATCTADGLEKILCTVCSDTIATNVIPKINHVDLPFIYNNDVTASTDGTVTAACPHCDYTDTKTLVGSAALIAEAFAGKKISILGDSISTYENISSGVASDTTNSNIRNNIVWYGYNPNYPQYGGESFHSTWWQRTIDTIGATRLVNNSHSGESVFKAVIDRCMQLHDDTGANAGETPDIIFVYLGTNDITRNKGNAFSFTMSDIERMAEDDNYSPQNLAEAYAVMLCRIQKTYPNAEIFCLTNLERSDANVSVTHDVCKVIRDVVSLFDGVHLVDIGAESGITRDNPDYEVYMPVDQGGKSLHPGAEGMKEIARVLIETMLENSRYMPEDFDELFPEINGK